MAKTLVVGLVGLIVGAVLGAALRPDRDPPRSSPGRTIALETKLARFERGMERLAERMDRFQQGGGAPQSEQAALEKRPAAGTESAPEQPGARSGRLFELARRPMEEQKLRALEDAKRPDEDLDQAILKQHAFKTYREILGEFGRPSEVSANADGVFFRYVFTDREDEGRGIAFVFADGFVFRVSVYRTSAR